MKPTSESPICADKDAISVAYSGFDSVPESMSEDSGLMTPAGEGSMESELRCIAPEVYDDWMSRSAEKVMVKSRRSRTIEGASKVGTDDPEPITKEFAEQIKRCSILLKFVCFNESTRKELQCLGQASFIRNPNNGSIMFVTCKHNFATAPNKQGQIETCDPPHKLVLEDETSVAFIIPNTGWIKDATHSLELRNGAKWSDGFDLAVGPVIDENTANEMFTCPVKQDRLSQWLPHAGHFEAVGDDFSYDHGLKIGIVVYSPKNMDKEEAFSEVNGLVDIDIEDNYANRVRGGKEAKIRSVLGDPAYVMIYTGTISFNGIHHIEYDVNSFKGCSGAAVIVMDRNHADYGKALAVHAGHSHMLTKNIAFKLASAWEP